MIDDLWRPADQFPLGRMVGLREVDAEEPSSPDTRPFGLRFATNPNATGCDSLAMAALDYDPDRQIAVMHDGESVLPAFKHTSNQTSTETASHDRDGGDSDTDVGGD